MDKSILTSKTSILETDYTPTYEQLYIHPEEGETFEINNKLTDIKYDLKNLNNMMQTSADNLNALLTSTVNRIEAINKKIISEKERLQDIKILCNKYTDFDKVVLVNPDNINLYGNAKWENEAFSLSINNFKKLSLKLDTVAGNGEIGNKYVYKNYLYVSDSLNTTNPEALFDDSLATYWEYQRITAASTEKYLLNNFYMDNEEAKCTLTIMSNKEKMNELIVTTDIENLKIIDMQYSDDNINYEHIDIPTITFSKLDCYDNNNYVYGSGILLVPSCKYVKITFQSNGSTNDAIAFEKVMFEEETFNEDTINNTHTETVEVKTAKRHLIKINDIQAYNNSYNKNSYIQTQELIQDAKLYSVSVFANVYIPEGLNSDSVEFILTVNGIDYSVVPINDNTLSGTKIVRYSQGNSKTEYTELTNEIITSAYLTIKLKGTKELSPYVNNIKVLFGGEI